MKQLLTKYSKQEWAILVLFLVMIGWLFSILSYLEPNIDEGYGQDVSDSSENLVYNRFNDLNGD